MASHGFRMVETRWLLLLAALLLMGILLQYRALRMTHPIPRRPLIKETTDRAAFRAGRQQVLLPFSQLEEVRRQVATGMWTTHVFLLYHLEQMAKSKTGQEATQVRAVLAEAADRLRVTQLDLSSLDRLAGLSAWRDREAAALSQVVQQRLHTLQNPVDCHTAKKLICQADRNAGVGSLMHDVVLCFMAAYESGRTLVLKAEVKNRLGTNWEDLFLLPSPPSCRNITSNMINWPGTRGTEAVYYRPPFGFSPPPSLQPFAVPRDLASRVVRFSDMPGAWFVGQLVSYLMRLQPSLQRKIDTIKNELNYSHPIVGIHVRRTDKLVAEAGYHSVEEYMKHVENYYLGLDLASPAAPPTPRRVFLATEEPSVVSEVRRKFPKYEFLWHPNKAKAQKTRDTSSGHQDFVADLYLLAHADYLVCTLSSNVGRLAFEWMQSLRTDASSRVVSLDLIYYYYPMRNRQQLVRFPHNPDPSAQKKGFKKVDAGEQVSSARDMAQSGYRRINLRSKWALLPDYKLQDIVDVVNSTFPEPFSVEDQK